MCGILRKQDVLWDCQDLLLQVQAKLGEVGFCCLSISFLEKKMLERNLQTIMYIWRWLVVYLKPGEGLLRLFFCDFALKLFQDVLLSSLAKVSNYVVLVTLQLLPANI